MERPGRFRYEAGRWRFTPAGYVPLASTGADVKRCACGAEVKAR